MAVFAPADALSLHTRFATEAREIGASLDRGADPVRAYLDIEAMIAVAKASGCDCVHPGYGFLSENAAVRRSAARTRASRFVGPRPAALAPVRRQGQGARVRAARCGIPVVPGSADALLSVAEATALAPGARLSGDAEGRCRRRRARHARGRPRRGHDRGVRALPERGAGGLRRRRGVPREARRAAPAHRGAGAGRRAAAASCTCTSATARCSCATRRWSRSRRRRTSTTALRQRILADALKLARAAGYENAGTVEFLVSPETRRALVHRVQSAHPGRAHGHRAGDGRRPGRGAVPHRRRARRWRRSASATSRRSARRAASRSRRASSRRASAR